MVQGFFWGLTALAGVGAGMLLGGLRPQTVVRSEKKLLVLRLGAAVLTGLDSALLLALLHRMLPTDSLLPAIAAGCACALCWGLYLFAPLSLFPPAVDALAYVDRTQNKPLRYSILRAGIVFLLLGLWFVFVLLFFPAGAFFVFRAGGMVFCALLLLWCIFSEYYGIRAACERLELRLDKQYQAELLEFMQVIRSQRHDFNFHMQAVSGMIDQGQFDACARYIHELVKGAEHLNDLLPLHDPVIGAQINAFRELASMQQVRMEVQVLSQLEHLPCSLVEINTILGNLLQNALDEVSQLDEENRWIRLLLMRRSRRYIVRVSNPSRKDPKDYEQVFRAGYSTKRSHEGLGLANVRRVVGKYGGTIYLEHEPGVVHFIVRLPEAPPA